MILPKTPVAAILAGSVTECRIPQHRWTPKRKESLRSAHVTRVPYKRGEGFRTERKAGERICRLKIVRFQLAPLETEDADRDYQAARREGYRDHEHWLSDYFNAYGNVSVTDTSGWWVEFEIDTSDEILLLQKGAGYTSSSAQAIEEEPEAVNPVVVEQLPARMIAQQRWVKDRAERLRNRQGMTPGEMLDAYLVDAQNRHIDVHGPVREIERQLSRVQRRIDQAA